MNRRAFVTGFGAVLAVPLAAEAQQPEKVWRIGVLVPVEPESPTEPNVAAFRQGLHDLGYVEGQNIAVEYRYAHGKVELYPQLAAELVRLKVDVMVVGSGAPTVAAKNATHTIPIVGVGMGGDPVAIGLVTSLARPGGNVTGVSYVTGGGFFGKYVQLLKEVVPGISRVGYLRDPRNPSSAVLLREAQTATRAFGLKLQDLGVRELDEVDGMLATISKQRGASVIVAGELLLMRHPNQITELAARHRLPAIYGMRLFMDVGGLMFYGPNLADLWRRAATYVDKILKGAKPADLPVEQPTKVDLVINLKTAKALSLTIPPSLLLRADQVIE